MAATDSTNTSELLTKLSSLENQVAKLTLELDKKTQANTELLLSLTDRQSQIVELETTLAFAQKTLLDKTLEIIRSYQIKIKSGIYEKTINPVLDQIQNQLNAIQAMINQSKKLGNEKVVLLNDYYHSTKGQISEWPVKSRNYLEQEIINKLKSQINEVITEYVSIVSHFSEQKIIKPASMFYENLLNIAKTIPAQYQDLLEKKFLGTVELGQNFLQKGINTSTQATNEIIKFINLWYAKLSNSISDYIETHSSRPIIHNAAPA